MEVNERSTHEITNEHAILIPALSSVKSLLSYAEAVAVVIGACHIHSVYEDGDRIKIYLRDKRFVDILVNNGVSILGREVNVDYAIPRADKIILTNVDPVVPDSILRRLLHHYGSPVSSIIHEKIATNSAYSHIECGKRKVYMNISPSNRLPAKINFTYRDMVCRVDVMVEPLPTNVSEPLATPAPVVNEDQIDDNSNEAPQVESSINMKPNIEEVVPKRKFTAQNKDKVKRPAEEHVAADVKRKSGSLLKTSSLNNSVEESPSHEEPLPTAVPVVNEDQMDQGSNEALEVGSSVNVMPGIEEVVPKMKPSEKRAYHHRGKSNPNPASNIASKLKRGAIKSLDGTRNAKSLKKFTAQNKDKLKYPVKNQLAAGMNRKSESPLKTSSLNNSVVEENPSYEEPLPTPVPEVNEDQIDEHSNEALEVGSSINMKPDVEEVVPKRKFTAQNKDKLQVPIKKHLAVEGKRNASFNNSVVQENPISSNDVVPKDALEDSAITEYVTQYPLSIQELNIFMAKTRFQRDPCRIAWEFLAEKTPESIEALKRQLREYCQVIKDAGFKSRIKRVMASLKYSEDPVND